MVACVCAVPIAPLVSAFPVYTTQAELQTDFSVANAMLLPDTIAGLHARLGGVSDSPLVESSPSVLAATPTETQPAPNIEARYPLTESPSLAEPPFPDTQLQSLTIAGTQYSTGLALDPNDCKAKAGSGAVCDVIENAFFDLALAWAPEQLTLQEWHGT